MRVIAKPRLRKFWETKGQEDAEKPLLNWWKVVNNDQLSWESFADIRRTFAHPDVFKDCVIFNIGGNKYRLIAKVRYRKHLVFVVKILTHEEYDLGIWKAECRCQKDSDQQHRISAQSKTSRRRK